MEGNLQPVRNVAIIGGGIAGLAAAYRLTELAPATRVTLFEAGPRLGGVLQTEQAGDFLLEYSADNFITNTPWAIDLCRRIGLAEELLPTDNRRRSAFIVHRGRLLRVPEGFMLMQPRRLWPLVTSPLLSPWGKLRALAECLVPRRVTAGDESLAAFARRRLGREAYERLVQPLVGGIYTADAERLSLAATLPRFIEMERQHGGLIRAAWRARSDGGAPQRDGDSAESGARYGLFAAPRGGMSSLVEALAARLPPGTVRLNTMVEAIAPVPSGWEVRVLADQQGGDSAEPHATPTTPHSALRTPHSFDSVILAVPAHRAAALIEGFDSALAADLAAIEYAGCALVLVGYAREQIEHPLDAFGFVVPEVEQRRILACSFSSQKFPGRAGEDQVLLRVFVGGARRPDLVELPDDELRRIVIEELAELLGARGEPLLFRVVRWRRAMPQYHLGHLERVARIEVAAAAHHGLALCGNAYRGVGIPDCIRSGEEAAARVQSAAM